jgi:hypothetical protein
LHHLRHATPQNVIGPRRRHWGGRLRRGGGDGFSLSPLVPPSTGQTIAAAPIAPRQCCHRLHAPSKDVDAAASDDFAPPVPARRSGCGGRSFACEPPAAKHRTSDDPRCASTKFERRRRHVRQRRARRGSHK